MLARRIPVTRCNAANVCSVEWDQLSGKESTVSDGRKTLAPHSQVIQHWHAMHMFFPGPYLDPPHRNRGLGQRGGTAPLQHRKRILGLPVRRESQIRCGELWLLVYVSETSNNKGEHGWPQL